MGWRQIFRYALYSLRAMFRRQVLLALICTLLGVMLLSTLATWLFEQTHPDGIRRFSDVLWWAGITLVGVADPGFFPISIGGRLVGVTLNLFQILFLALMSTVLVSVFIRAIMREGQGMLITNFQDHIIICGWNEMAREITTQLVKSEDEDKLQLVIITEEEARPDVVSADVHWIRGKPSSEETLRRAGVERARAAVVFPCGSPEDVDARSLMTALAVESIHGKVYTVAAVENARNVEHFAWAKVDEVIPVNEINAALMARCVLHPGLSSMLYELLRNDADNEFYRIPAPPGWIGRSFNDALVAWREEEDIILIGVERQIGEEGKERRKTFVNPRGEFKLQAKDSCLVIAYDPPSFDQERS